jgi:cytochrome c
MGISLPGTTRVVVLLALAAGPSDALVPNLKGVFGRRSASLDGFRYSNPMKRANLVWDEDNLRAYIRDPQGKVKGNRMPYGGMSDPRDVDDVIVYLKTLK